MQFKKILAVLSAVLLLGVQSMPVNALTFSENPDTGILSEAPPMPETFTIQTDTMTFEGYVDYNYVTLVKCDETLTSVEIPAEVIDPETGTVYPVNYVNAEAFTNCTNLQEITVNENQKNYTSIDGMLCSADSTQLIAYPQAKSTESITIPEGITGIQPYVFLHHPAKEITLPDSCITIWRSVFSENLEKIHLGKSLRSFEYSAFMYAKNLKEITLSEGNASFTVEDNILYSWDKSKLYLYPSQKPETSYTVPETVTELSSFALKGCDALEEIILPEGLTKVENNNFNNCKSLKTLTIPEGVTSLSRVGNNCESLETLYLPSTLTYVYDIFSKCGLKDVYFNNTQDYWYNMANVKSTAVLTYPAMHFSDDNDYVKFNENGIDYRVYADKAVVMGCDKDLTEIHIPAQVENVPVIEIHSEAFQNHENLKSVEIPETVVSIGNSAFYNSALESVNLPEGLTELGASAFMDTNLTEMKIPDTITELNGGMFYNCQKLKSVTLPANLETIGANAFFSCAIEEITIPETLTKIQWSAFESCTALKEITLPKSVNFIADNVFRSCEKLEKITILNPDCQIDDSAGTICNFYSAIELPPDGCIVEIEVHTEFSGTIFGYENSTVQAYAEKYGYTFQPLEAKPLKAGDATGDGDIDILDVITLNKAVLGKETFTEAQLKAIDFNGNGKPDADEALMLLKYIVGIIEDFTV